MNPIYSFLNGSLPELDPETASMIECERRRQERKIILIASESVCPPAVLEAQASVFSNIYAEGYPSPKLSRVRSEEVLDFEKWLPLHRRLGDKRHYQGCDYVNFIEALAQRRAAELFAHDDGRVSVPAERIYANVQPLSGAAANNAVYQAFVNPGEKVLGMALPHGGHLTHGSRFNRSGKIYQGISYEVDPATGRIDYEGMRKLAREHRPRLIIGGASAYPWHIDWKTMREIADEVDAMLLADIAHPSGLVAAGLFPNPIGYAHVVSMTTHKTLCGPRAAILLSTDRQIAKKLDSGVFPGEQGGPHINTIAALAVAFRLAATQGFRDLMKKVLENAQALAHGLQKRGFEIAYGGTETHLCLIDLRKISPEGEIPIKGSVAAQLLELCGIVCNKNTIPGDVTAGDSSAIRLGTTWVSQLGMGAPEMDALADIIHRVLTQIRPYTFLVGSSLRYRGKVPMELLLDARHRVAELMHREEHPRSPRFPHYHIPFDCEPRGHFFNEDGDSPADCGETAWKGAEEGAAVVHDSEAGILEISGERAELFLADLVSADVFGLKEGCGLRTFLLDKDGVPIDDVTIFRMPCEESKGSRFWMITNAEPREMVKEWLSDLCDGHVLLNEESRCNKLIGPPQVRDLSESANPIAKLALAGPRAVEFSAILGDLAGMPPMSSRRVEWSGAPLFVARTGFSKEDVLYEIYLPQSHLPRLVEAAKKSALPFTAAGRPVIERLRRRAHLPATERGKALFERFPGYFGPRKPYFVGAEAVLPAVESPKPAHDFKGYAGEPRHTPLAEEHKKLTKRALSPFAGWWMPILYTSILSEHKAVRERAGLFDVTHMGVIEVKGKGAVRFLDLVATNEVGKMKIGQSQYSYLLTPDAQILDDIMVYRKGPENFMVVINASNAEKDFDWLRAVLERRVMIDPDRPDSAIDVQPVLRDLRHPDAGPERRVDIALQGPASKDIVLAAAGNDSASKEKIETLFRTQFTEVRLGGISVLLSRSGYTGESMGYELYVHPDSARDLWTLLLEKGRDRGIEPTGLGARDSTRTEAGFPLHGHELAGAFEITPMEAGYGSFVKYYKPFFIGKKALHARDKASRRQIVRFEMKGAGTRAVRPGSLALNPKGQVIGVVTSCTFVGDKQIGMAYVDRRCAAKGTPLAILHLPQGKERPLPLVSELKIGDNFSVPAEACVISRFLRKKKAPAKTQ